MKMQIKAILGLFGTSIFQLKQLSIGIYILLTMPIACYANSENEPSAIASPSCLPATSQVSNQENNIRVYLIDLGGPDYQTVGNWNNTGAQSNGATISNLIDSAGGTSTIDFVVVDEADNGYGSGNGYNSNGGYIGEALGYPASACRDSYLAWNGGGQYKFSGLVPGNEYSIKIFGSRMTGSAGRVGQYTINGRTLTHDAQMNTTESIEFTDLLPDVNGEIFMDFATAPGSNFAYLGVIEITENTTTVTAPDSLVLTLLSPTSVQLDWHDNSDNEDGFVIERSIAGGGSFIQITTLPTGSTSFTDTSLSFGTPYDYKVIAFNSSDSSATSLASTQTSDSPYNNIYLIDLGSPAYPTAGNWNNVTGNQNNGVTISNLIDSEGTVSTIDFVVIDDADNGYIDGNGYNPDGGYDGVALGYPASACKDSYLAWNGGGQYKFTGLMHYYKYNIKIFGSRMTGSGGRKGQYTINGQTLTHDAQMNTTETIEFTDIVPDSNGEIFMDFATAPGSDFAYLGVIEITENTTTVAAPDSLVLALISPTSVQLDWRDNSDSEMGFVIERNENNTGFVFLDSLSYQDSTQYIDTTVNNDYTYLYRVLSYDAVGHSMPSVPAIINITDTVPPSPTGLSASVTSANTIALSWSDNSFNESGFIIYRSTRADTDIQQYYSGFTQVGTASANSISYIDTLSHTGVEHSYAVVATNFLGNSDSTNIAAVAIDLDTDSEGQVPDFIEYNALKAIYDNMGGDNWNNNTNWLIGETSADFNTWDGITVEQKDIYEINLSYNNLTGSLPEEIGSLRELWGLYFSNNKIQSLPLALFYLEKTWILDFDHNQIEEIPWTITYFEQIPYSQLNFSHNLIKDLPYELIHPYNTIIIWLENNFLGFEDIEPYFLDDDYDSYDYPVSYNYFFDPQNLIGNVDTLELAIDTTLLLKSNIEGEYTSWQWQKLDSSNVWIDLTGATDSLYTIQTITLSDSGSYRCVASSSWVTDIIIYTAPITVYVIEEPKHYAITSGAWDDPSTWSPTEGGSPGVIIPNPNSEVYIDGFEVEVTNDAECERLIINNQQQAALLNITNGKLSIGEEINIFNDHPSNPESKVAISGNGALVIAEQ